MIPQITASTIYSTLGNNSSRIPLAIKDCANSCGLTTASYIAGDKLEGKDRFIDEFGTQAVWLGGIPAYQKLLDYTMFKPMGLDAKVDARLLKDENILKAAQELAPTKAIKDSIITATKNQKTFKNLTMAKFVASTVLTTLTYLGLTKFRHKYTENQIKKDYLANKKQNITFNDKTNNVPFSSAFADIHNTGKTKTNNKNVTFTGGVQDFIFDPVKNLMLVDGAITSERLVHARNPQDFFGYVIKEGSFWAFMYFAGPLIAKALEKNAENKHHKSIDLDARVIESKQLEEAFKNGTLKTQIEAFKSADKSNVDIYKYTINKANLPKEHTARNLVVDMASLSDIIGFDKTTSKVDTRKYIDLSSLRGVSEKLEKLLNQYEASNETVDEFLKSVRRLKRHAVLKNIGACIGALGILAPAIMLAVRHFSPEYQVKKDIEKKLSEEQSKGEIYA